MNMLPLLHAVPRVGGWCHGAQGWLAMLGLAVSLVSPAANALPQAPESYTVVQLACATVGACSDAQLRDARQTLSRQPVRVGEQTLALAARACQANRLAVDEATALQNLTPPWNGLKELGLTDTTRVVKHSFACNDSTYAVVEMEGRSQPLFVVTPDGLLLVLDRPRAAMAPPPRSGDSAGAPPPPPTIAGDPPRSSPPGAVGERQLNTVRVFFGTSRAKEDNQPLKTLFGTERGELVVGELEVSLPPTHAEGDIERPKWWRFELSEDPDKHVVLQAITPWPMSSFRKNLGEALAKDPQGATFLFIHGFNVSFHEAALRTAQMAWDLRLTTAPLMFSWPSQGKVSRSAYDTDETNVVWTVPHLQTFLREVTQQSGAKKIHVIAHSMGNRALVQALQGFERPNNRPRFNQIILAAADIDAEIFKDQIAPGVMAAGQRVTIYASDHDLALKASKDMNGYKRVGDAGGGAPIIIPGIDTVDASAVRTDFLGHSYFAEEVELLKDIRLLLQTGASAAARKLRRQTTGLAEFWSVK